MFRRRIHLARESWPRLRLLLERRLRVFSGGVRQCFRGWGPARRGGCRGHRGRCHRCARADDFAAGIWGLRSVCHSCLHSVERKQRPCAPGVANLELSQHRRSVLTYFGGWRPELSAHLSAFSRTSSWLGLKGGFELSLGIFGSWIFLSMIKSPSPKHTPVEMMRK